MKQDRVPATAAGEVGVGKEMGGKVWYQQRQEQNVEKHLGGALGSGVVYAPFFHLHGELWR